MKNSTILIILALTGCDTGDTSQAFRVDCPEVTTSSSSDETTASTTGEPSYDPSAIPTPTATCPSIVEGNVTFCPSGLATCRSALVVNAANANNGPLVMHWHETGRTVEQAAATYHVGQIRNMVQANAGLLVLPREDTAATARPNNIFPWWVVCGVSPSECNRPDDFILADEIVACAVEQGLVSQDRLNISGFSAGAIQVAHLVDRVGYFASAVTWSGGLIPIDYQPLTPIGSTPVMALHGGTNDDSCVGATCFSFLEHSESMTIDLANADRFAFNCDHQSGHSINMSPEAALFMRDARRNLPHPWIGYPFGDPGTGPSWTINQNCYAAGSVSPR